ncbi:hypothetical protein ERO13_A06G183800v2 [Gossypium hirsutum]|uniref:Uncharacterized protein isoform X2 n=2 Tax=Gossypium TaxID=3633 RepID=A0ABM3BYP4_GOSHI|nr:uncharacterized protein LOC121230806 isoform X2 [Gossypium hirsutum]KAG4196643.1 hypothetical protein ERO13_A06G183800v2 [Gossypium hirsutum]TYH14495.1 hypothetical protein ES288_A06G224600v1 [Gossypium darwinii]
MSEEEWVKEALTDSMLAAKVLLSLYQASSPPPRSDSASSQALQVEWSVRQRRSKQSLKKKSEPARASPTTPLSWSGGISVSGGGSADGSEESSRPPLKPVDNARSKVAATSEITPPKRSRRKKTLAELKEEISSHLKENRSLKNLASHRATETSTACIEPKINATSEPPQQREVASHTSAACNENKRHPPNECSEGQDMTKASCDDASFALPDLNLPIEDDSGL